MKLRLFVDFWNFQLSVNDLAGKDYRVEWKKLSPWLLGEARTLIDPSLSFEETRVYLSFNPRRTEDKGLRDWANNTLDRFPDIHVLRLERRPPVRFATPQLIHAPIVVPQWLAPSKKVSILQW
jgi:hypothetical protein